jgi:DNA-binding NarL/FixJ family response regulator
METIQIAIANASYASSLKDLLARTAGWKILRVDAPDPRTEGVIVVDSEALERLPSLIVNPERVVLITHNDAPHLAKAWEAGIVSVVYENDPINTALLAIMAARLRVAKAARPEVAASAAETEGGRLDQSTPRRRELS